MRIVLDTNVLVSAFISKVGHSAKILDLISMLEGVQLVLSEPILEEFKDVLFREEVKIRFEYSARDIESFTQAIRSISEIVKIKSNFKVVKEDPKDDVVLNTAYDGKADYIVSGDHHLQKIKKFKGIKIVNPKQMVRIIAKRFSELII
jgi:hypothetical protein